jgi:hypothetical protein
MLASASATYRTTLAHLVSSNAQVLTNLAEKAALLGVEPGTAEKRVPRS